MENKEVYQNLPIGKVEAHLSITSFLKMQVLS